MEKLRTAWQSDFAWSFRRSPVAVISLAMVVLLVLAAVVVSQRLEKRRQAMPPA